jgi:hypothetical protein
MAEEERMLEEKNGARAADWVLWAAAEAAGRDNVRVVVRVIVEVVSPLRTLAAFVFPRSVGENPALAPLSPRCDRVVLKLVSLGVEEADDECRSRGK